MPKYDYDPNDTAQENLVRRVIRRADRQTPSGQSIGPDEERIYEDDLVDAVRYILNEGPRRAVDEVSTDASGGTVTNVSNRTEIVLPDEFVRFLNLELGDWNRAVYTLVDPRSSKHRTATIPSAGADAHNPVATKVARATESSGHVLLAYPQDSGPTVEHLNVVEETRPENLPDDLVPALTFRAAGYFLQSEQEQGATTALKMADALLRQVAEGQVPIVGEAVQNAE